MRFRAAMLAACVHAHGTLEYPPSRAMGVGSTGTDLDSWTSSSVCGEPYGSCYWFTELVGINGLGPFPAEGHVPATQTPAYAPGTAPIEGSGCGAAGGGPTNNYPRAGTAPKMYTQGQDGVTLPPISQWTPPTWKVGDTVDVAFGINADHRGQCMCSATRIPA